MATRAAATPAVFLILFWLVVSQPALPEDVRSASPPELRQQLSGLLETMHRRLGEKLFLEESVLGSWRVADLANLPPWSVVAWSDAGVAAVRVRVFGLTGKLQADVVASLVVGGEAWSLGEGLFTLGADAPPNSGAVLEWLLRWRRSQLRNVSVTTTQEEPVRELVAYHSSALLCAIGACFGRKGSELVWIGPDLGDNWPGHGPGASGLTVMFERHYEALSHRDREFFRQQMFDAGLPVLVRHARKVSVDPESGLVVVEAEKTKLWLSPQYGYQPVRREWYCLVEDHLLAVDEFSDYREIGDGVWLPFRWHRKYERDAYRGEVSDAVVVVRRAELRAPDEAELRELFFNAVPEERTYVVDFRWLRNPFTGRPRHVTYPFRRDPAELAALREQAVARARAQMAWILRVGPGAGDNAAVPLAVAALLLLAMAGLFVWVAWRRRRRKQDA